MSLVIEDGARFGDSVLVCIIMQFPGMSSRLSSDGNTVLICDFSELAVKSFDGVGRIDQASDCFWILPPVTIFTKFTSLFFNNFLVFDAVN